MNARHGIEEPSGSRFILAADGIRGLACLLVLIAHHVWIFRATHAYLDGCGKIGVWLFFVLSAYLLTHKFILNDFTRASLADYCSGRFFRIIPLFSLAVGFYYLAGTAGINSRQDVVRALFFRAGFAHLWTIPVEFKFYAILPPVVWLILQIYHKFQISGVLVTALCLIFIHQFFYPYWLLPENSIEVRWYIPAFLVGIAAAFLDREVHSRTANICGFAVILIVLLATPFMRQQILGIKPTGYLTNKYLYFCVLWAIFIVTQAQAAGLIGRVMQSRYMAALGHWSYSIYLIHWYFVMKAGEIAPDKWWSFLLSLGLSITSGWLLFVFIERPISSFRSKLRYRFLSQASRRK